jgi:hypothetical protein
MRMLTAELRGRAEWEAESLNVYQRDFLTGRKMRRRVLPDLVARGLTDEAGRVTPFGAEVARVPTEDGETWTEVDSAALSAALVALDGHPMRLHGEALKQAIAMMVRDGLTAVIASQRLGLTPERCSAIARELGRPFVHPDRRPGAFSNKQLYRLVHGAGRTVSRTWRSM